jgi:hypothetical protein
MFVEASVVIIAGVAAAMPVAVPRRPAPAGAPRATQQAAY